MTAPKKTCTFTGMHESNARKTEQQIGGKLYLQLALMAHLLHLFYHLAERSRWIQLVAPYLVKGDELLQVFYLNDDVTSRGLYELVRSESNILRDPCP